jgi:hypothetical protein
MPHGEQFVPIPNSSYGARDYIVKSLIRDLVGPGWKEGGMEPDKKEILTLDSKSQPSRYYLTGMLMPQIEEEEVKVSSEEATHIEATTLEEMPPEMFSEGSKSEFIEKDNKEANRVQSGDGLLTPRSIGLTVHPSPSVPSWDAVVNCEWGTYHQKNPEDRDSTTSQWQRVHHEYTTTISSSDFLNQNFINLQLPNYPNIRLHMRSDGLESRSLTVRLVNDAKHPKSDWVGICDSTMLQVSVRVEIQIGLQDVRSDNNVRIDDMDLLYADSKVLASGHNTGVDWDSSKNTAWTTAIPSYEVPLMRGNTNLQKFIPSLDQLCDEEDIVVALQSVEQFVNEYKIWLDGQIQLFHSQTHLEKFTHIFHQHAENVQQSLDRMKNGADFLLRDSVARESFRLANCSIRFSQRDLSLNKAYRIENFEWRPFQFAFQLLNVEGLLQKNHQDRQILDLAWFPTGGGKTEAYLGLIATTSFYRRLNPETGPRESEAPGISAIMRYTLRLLTADQAGRLIRLCGAMNHLWERTDNTGPFAPFTVGMWIGESSSPNKFFSHPDYQNKSTVTVETVFDHHIRGEELPESSFIQFRTCPWCGDDSVGDVENWEIIDVPSPIGSGLIPKLVGRCTMSSCIFDEGLPFSCVDEDLYLHPPTILLGTVDKMVQLAHNNHAKSLKHGETEYDFIAANALNSRRMFGFDSSGPLPPSLIIQDELHLLSGPLGTLAGMIETALTAAWAHQNHHPKYVAATATIRGASRDIGLIYGRKLNVFPPPLLTAKDNFFAQEQEVNGTTPGRIHLGILAPPRRSRSATDQPSASLLQSVQNLRSAGVPDEVLDPYWTLVMYYNSLRELGGGQSSLRENIPRWMDQYSVSSNSELRNLAEGGDVELTSRKSASELALSRQRLNIELGTDPQYVVDVLSTSNMFQVGVDIPRLGLMNIIGQPRSNSEYIQSSGRVGRKASKPGIVLSVLRGTYPRDQSHYEQFRSFHQEFYRHVDFTSVTPFTHRALDRGFATSLMLLLRMGSRELASKEGPVSLRSNRVRDDAGQLVERFSNIVRDRQDQLADVNPEHTQTALQIIESEWDRLKRLVDYSDAPVWWIVWNDLEIMRMDPSPISWMRSPFRISDAVYPGDLVEGLPSLRDVASEVQMKTVVGHDYSTMPEGHLLSHMAPGNVWEKGGIPYLTLGISRWDNTVKTGFNERTVGSEALNSQNHPITPGQCIEEPSLSAILGHERALRLLPKASSNASSLGEFGAVTYQKYPWVFICDTHGHISTGETFDRELKHHVCKRPNCKSKTRPSRFISLCVDGHMSPFDYWFWVHSGKGDKCKDHNQMRLKLGGDAALTLSNWVVHCDACGLSRDMLNVPWVKAEDRHDSPQCKGSREWLAHGSGGKEDCSHRMVHRQVGNTSVSMNEGGSIMIIPPYVGWNFVDAHLMQRLRHANSKEEFRDGWISDVKSKHYSVQPYIDRLIGSSYQQDGIIDHDGVIGNVWQYYQQHSGDEILTLANLRRRERIGLVTEDGNSYDQNQFSATVVAGGFQNQPEKWHDGDWPLRSANQIHRLTELRYIDAIRRLETDPTEGSPQPLDLPAARASPGPDDQFGIGMYNHGEGLYFDIKPNWLQGQVERRSHLQTSHVNMDLSFNRLMPSMTRQLPSLEVTDNRSGFTILHTLSHALIKSLAETSGFSLGSVRERLYYHCEDGEIIDAGILLYTSAPSSDGTLGGLVQQGSTTERFEVMVRKALENLQTCSNDPICSEHLPTAEETNGAACHTCVLLPETSCEFANHMLDRTWG